MSSKIITLLLLVGLALQTHAGKCPEQLPYTCECSHNIPYGKVDIDLTCELATIMDLKDVLNQIDKTSRLFIELKGMNLETLTSEVFDGWNVATLMISYCELDKLSPNSLASLEDKLEELVIRASFTDSKAFTKIDLSRMKRLKKLTLAYNSITELSNDWFANGPASLTDIFLWSNRIFKLGDRAFSNLSNLRYLEINGNTFGELKRSMLPKPANRLENLALNKNGFTNFADDLFTEMPALKELLISDNGIAHLQEQTFKSIWSQLGYFDATGNPLQCDSTMEWLFDVKKPSKLLGTCQGPLGRAGLDLDEFIENKGQ